MWPLPVRASEYLHWPPNHPGAQTKNRSSGVLDGLLQLNPFLSTHTGRTPAMAQGGSCPTLLKKRISGHTNIWQHCVVLEC